MAELGKYCKAYLAKDFRRFDGWTADLDKDAVLYLQENYTVTEGLFIDEKIVFDEVTDEWIGFCRDELGFEIPEYEPIEIPEASSGEPGLT